MTQAFPDEEKFGLSSQVRRSSASICANIAEGYKKSRKNFLRYLDIAQASLEETKFHLILSKDLGFCPDDRFKSLFDLSEEIGKMLNGLTRRLSL